MRPHKHVGRRLMATGAAVAAVTGAAAVAAAINSGGATALETSAAFGQNSPLTADRSSIHSTIEAAAKQALGADVSGQPTRFVSLGDGWTTAPVESAQSAYVLFGSPDTHSWKVFSGTTDGVSKSNPCAATATAAAAAVSCDAVPTADGGWVVTTTTFLQTSPDYGVDPSGRAIYAVVPDADSLKGVDLQGVRVERNVRYTRGSGAMTSVTEVVLAPTSLDPSAIFDSQVDELTKVATSPDLVWK